MQEADGFLHNDYAKLGRQAAEIWRDTGDATAFVTFFETSLKDFYVGDLANPYTAVALVETLDTRELEGLLKADPRIARSIEGAVRKFPQESINLDRFDRARVRVKTAMLENVKNESSGWRAP